MTLSQTAKQNLCQVSGVSKDFFLPHGQTLHLLRDIDFCIYPGEIVAIIGPSGCGKSTLLRIIMGLEKATKGEVLYKGKKQSDLLPDVSMVFQSFAIYPWMTVQENIALALQAKALDRKEVQQKVQEAILLVGLSGFEDAYPKEISGGMKQRVGIARALVKDPELLVMDEPFSSLDAFTAEGLRAEVLNIWKQKKRKLSSILLVSHDIQEVIYMADRIIVMESHPGSIRVVLENSLPRPRDYRSTAFLDLVEKVHSSYALKGFTKSQETRLNKTIAPLLSATYDEILGLLQYLSHRNGADDLYKIGSESSQSFERVIIVAEAAEQLNFIEIVHKTISLTEIGKKYVSLGHKDRLLLWKEQLLTLPLFRKALKRFACEPRSFLSKEELLAFLAQELPHQNAQHQLKLFVKWGRHGRLIIYHSKEKKYEFLY